MSGRLIGVVGPSGVGKDTVMQAMARAQPRLHLVRRVITRAPTVGGEDHDPASLPDFQRRMAAGEFCLHWQAHDMHYAIPQTTLEAVGAGQILMVNLSRSVLLQMASQVARFDVLHITAKPQTLAARLAQRGRETPAQIAKRLARTAPPLPAQLAVTTVANDGTPEATAQRALQLLGLAPDTLQKDLSE